MWRPEPFLAGVLLSLACGPSPAAHPAPEVMAVGAVDEFGRGILMVSTTGDRVYIETRRPSYVALVRLDAAGRVVAASSSGANRMQGTQWMVIPARPEASTRGDLESGSCPRVRGVCTIPASNVDMPMQDREMLILVISDHAIEGAELSDRVSRLPPRLPPAQLPAVLMGEHPGLWAAYLAVR